MNNNSIKIQLIVSKWSTQYKTKIREIVFTPTIPLTLWTSGYQWAKSNKVVTLNETDNVREYYCPIGEVSSCSEDEILNVSHMRWSTFEQFKRRAFSVWIVTFPNDADWINGSCTCRDYFKKYVCKHMVELTIRNKLVKVPLAAKQVPIGEKRSRGRPKLATQALLV